MRYHSTPTTLILVLAIIAFSLSTPDVPTEPSRVLAETSPQLRYFCDVSATLPRNRGDRTFICFHLAPINIKVVLDARIDEAAIFRIEGAYELLKDKTTPIDIIAQIQATKNYSVAVPYIRNTANLVYPINILNIILNKGVISGYSWQNICKGCGGDTSNNCKKEKLDTVLWSE
jgi:hypothetical protein